VGSISSASRCCGTTLAGKCWPAADEMVSGVTIPLLQLEMFPCDYLAMLRYYTFGCFMQTAVSSSNWRLGEGQDNAVC
jgi:hypothetical protein